MLIFKFVMFYGGALTALVATIFLWMFWHPELKVQALCDDANQTIRCKLWAVRTLSPIRLTGIWIPVEYVDVLGVSPPKGFREKLARKTPVWLYDNAKREVLIWSGRLEVARGQTVELSIPTKHPKAISGTLRLAYEFRGMGGVLLSAGLAEVQINKNET